MHGPYPELVPMLAYENESGGPGKRYRAEDLEGHSWMFVERGY